jgi:hypothetical protein
MDELEILKRDWKKKENSFNQITEKEIYGMLHKKSSSIVKWIFIVSICELSFGILLGFILSFTKYDKNNTETLKEWGVYNYYLISSIVIYIVVLYFIYKFYKMFRTIKVVDNVKQLISSILNTRKVVRHYIIFNLVAFAFIFLTFSCFVLQKEYTKNALENKIDTNAPIHVTILALLILIFITAILTFIVWLFYRLIYGTLLKRLNKNYKELEKLDL